MNARSLARLLEALDAELACKTDPGTAAGEILDRIKASVPGAAAALGQRLSLRKGRGDPTR